MKDLLIGMVVGVVTGYVLRKMEDDGKEQKIKQYSWDADNADERRYY